MSLLHEIAVALPRPVPSSTAIRDAVAAVCEAALGLIVVEDKGQLRGLVGANELIHALLHDEGQLVVRFPVQVAPHVSVDEALDLLLRRDAVELIVSAEGGYAAVTACALHRAAGAVPEDEPVPTIAAVAEATATTSPETPLREVASRIHDDRLELVIVVDDDKPIGGVTALDVVQAIHAGRSWDEPVQVAMATMTHVLRTTRVTEAEHLFKAGARYLIVTRMDGTLFGMLKPCALYRVPTGAHVDESRLMPGYRTSLEEWWEGAGAVGQGLFEWDIWRDDFWLSPSWLRYLGYPLSIGTRLADWTDRLHPEDVEASMADVQRFLRGTTEVFGNLHRVRAANGEYRWSLLTGWITARASSGEPLRMRGTVIDATEVVGYGAHEHEVAEELQAVLNAHPDPAWFVSVEGQCELVNTAMVQATGVARDLLVDRPIDTLWSALGPQARRLHDRALSTGVPQRALMWVDAATGRRWVELVSSPVNRREDGLSGVVTVARDMTAQRRVSDVLGQEREHLQAVLDQLPNLVCSADVNGKITHVNRRFLACVERTRATIVGKPWRPLLGADEAVAVAIDELREDPERGPVHFVTALGPHEVHWTASMAFCAESSSLVLNGTIEPASDR